MATPYSLVHLALREKLGITARAVNMRRAKIQLAVGMPDDIALFVAAQREGVPVHKWVKDADVLAQVASFNAAVAAKDQSGTSNAPKASNSPTRPSKNGASGHSGEFALDKIKIPAGVLSERHRRDAEQMARKVYPLLYAFENSVREFIDGHLAAAYGKDWYDEPNLVSSDVHKTVERNRKADTEHPTHSARNARPIYYTTLGELVLIVQSKKGAKVFKRPLFPRPTWFPELVKASEHTRNIVAHMNPIKAQDLRRLEVDFQDWQNQIKGHPPPTAP